MMDILVHLDGSAEDEVRLSYAELIANGREVHVGGLFTNVLPDMAAMASPEAAAAAAQIYVELEQAARDKGETLSPALSTRLGRIGPLTGLQRVDGTIGALASAAASAARLADLFIASAPYRSDKGWDVLVEAVLFGSGRATLLVPTGTPAARPVHRILVAWRDTRDAARALAEALPFVAGTSRVDIVIVDPDEADEAPAAGVARHLARHGAKAEVKRVASDGRTVAQAILDEAQRGAIDLIVMGAYGHTRLREWVLGGVTRDILQSTTVPVLAAH